MLRDGAVRTVSGALLALRVDTVCVHGDNPQAIALTRALRTRLEAEGVEFARAAKAAPLMLRVLRPGALTTVQDLGRPGHGRAGVSPSGAMDPLALRAANRLLGNAPGAGAPRVDGPGVQLQAGARGLGRPGRR